MLRFFDRLNLTPAERRLVVIIAAIAFVVLNYWLVWPRFSDFSRISDQIEEMKTKERIYQREIARQPVYAATLRMLQAEGSILPSGEENIQFRSEMERMARDIGLYVPQWGEVLAERGSGATTNAFFEPISLTMNRVSGNEEQFVEFLYNVGSRNSTIRVKELRLDPGNFDVRAQGWTNLIGTIKLVASVQKETPTLPPTVTATARPASPPMVPATNPVVARTHTNTVPSVRPATNQTAAFRDSGV
jgi:Tfp pilus assembly protein PilO